MGYPLYPRPSLSSCWGKTQETDRLLLEQLLWPGQVGGKKLLCLEPSRKGALPWENQDAAGCTGAEEGWEQAQISAPQEAVRDLCVFQGSRDRMLRGGRETDFLLQ